MKKKLLVLLTAFILTGCGTMVEPSRKSVTIQSVTPVKAYADGIRYVGEGTYITFDASNRSRNGDDYVVLREIGNEENSKTIYLQREYNPWSTWNILFFYGLPYIIDYPAGGTGRLAVFSYQMPDFSKKPLYNSTVKNSKDNEIEVLRDELERYKLKEEIKKELELERTKERVLKLEVQ